MDHAPSIIVLGLAAFLLPMVAGRMRLPAVVLEILFGIIVGPAVLGWIHSSEVLGYMAELGFLLLMFLSGFEIDFGKLERQGLGQITTGLTIFLVTIALAYFFAQRLGHGPFVTLVLATTSVGLVVPTLRKSGRSATALGQAILIAAILSDFLTLIGATIYAMIQEHGVGWNLLNFPLLFLVLVLFLFFIKRLAWWFPERFERLFDAEDPEEMGIRTCLALMFVFAGLSYMLDVETILGAFLAGTTFALVFRHRGQLEQKLRGFSYGFLIPIFFIHVGMGFDLQSLRTPGVLVGSLALLGAAVLLKIVAASVLLVKRFRLREVLAAGILLSARLSLVIAVARLGTRLGILDRTVESQVVMLAVVTATLCPTLFGWLVPPLRAAPVRQEDRLALPGEIGGVSRDAGRV